MDRSGLGPRFCERSTCRSEIVGQATNTNEGDQQHRGNKTTLDS